MIQKVSRKSHHYLFVVHTHKPRSDAFLFAGCFQLFIWYIKTTSSFECVRTHQTLRKTVRKLYECITFSPFGSHFSPRQTWWKWSCYLGVYINFFLQTWLENPVGKPKNMVTHGQWFEQDIIYICKPIYLQFLHTFHVFYRCLSTTWKMQQLPSTKIHENLFLASVLCFRKKTHNKSVRKKFLNPRNLIWRRNWIYFIVYYLNILDWTPLES